jgi:hypothetical protein
MRRRVIGILALVLLLAGALFWLRSPAQRGVAMQIESACWRIGGCLALLWLAYPDLRNIPRWFWLVALVSIVILARWPRLFLLAVPLLLVYALLRPLLTAKSRSQ